jgi:hypothetical protein
MKCDNCPKPAVWIFDDRGAANQHFCESCLPWFLTERAKTGRLTKVQAPAAVPVVEPVVEEPVVEPEPVMEVAEPIRPVPAPPKKAVAKK